MNETAVSSLVGEIQEDLGDPRGNRHKPAKVLAKLQWAQRELAKHGVFHRTDVHVPRGGLPAQAFVLFAEAHRILSVTWNGVPILPANQVKLQRLYGNGWQGQAGTPTLRLDARAFIRLVPTPEEAGEAILWEAGAPPISQDVGRTIQGDEYWAGMNGAALWHFLPGDGTTSNGDTAAKAVVVRYSYFPTPLASDVKVPSRWIASLRAGAVCELTRFSRDPRERELHLEARADWIREIHELGEVDPERGAADYAGGAIPGDGIF